MAWQDSAACKGRTDLSWFPATSEERGGQSFEYRRAIAAAVAVCRNCPVIAECREAGRTEHGGIWGGRSVSPRMQHRPIPDCGTLPGYRRHLRLHEPICDKCREVWAEAYHEAKDAATAAKVQAVRVILGRTG